MPFPWNEDDEKPLDAPGEHRGWCAWVLLIPFGGLLWSTSFLMG